MAHLTRKLVLFLSGLAVLFAAASVYFELRVRSQSNFYRQVAQFKDPATRPTVLLVGDSRMAVNITPDHLPPDVYNFSYPGETMRHLYLRVKYALKEKPSIKVLVIGLEDVLFSDARARLRDAVRQMAFADLADLTEVYPVSPRFLLRHVVVHYLPLINADQRRRTWDAWLDDMQSAISGQKAEAAERLPCGGIRFQQKGQWGETDRKERQTKARQRVDRLLGGSASNPEMRAVFGDILRLARRHGVRVIGLRNPVSGAYLDAARNYRAAPLLAFLDPGKLDGMLDYIDLFAESPDKFYNADHLNPDGSVLFTELLLDDLRRLVPINGVAAERCDAGTVPTPLVWPYNDVLSRWLSVDTNLNDYVNRA